MIYLDKWVHNYPFGKSDFTHQNSILEIIYALRMEEK